MARHDPAPGRSLPTAPGPVPRRVGVRQPVEPVAPDRHRPRPSRGSAYVCAGLGHRGWKPCRSTRRLRDVGDRLRTASIPASDRGWWSGARAVSASRSATTPGESATGTVNRVPPWTTRWPTASTAPSPPIASRTTAPSAGEPAASTSAEPTTASDESRTLSLRLLEPALTTRTLRGRRRRSCEPSTRGLSPATTSPRPPAGPRPRASCTPAPRSACPPSPGARARHATRGPAPGR